MTRSYMPSLMRRKASRRRTPSTFASHRDEYDKLPSQGALFRLLQLFPGNHKQLKCDIAIYTLDAPDTPSYRALSLLLAESQVD